MPLKKARKGSSKAAKQKVISANIREMHKGSTYARTKRKHGAKVANRQAVAAAMTAARGGKKRRRR